MGTVILFFLGGILGFLLGVNAPKDVPVSPGSPSPSIGKVSITPSPPDASPRERVLRVIDGDTIELETGQKIRYIGIDTPETVDPRRPVECFGTQAKERNRQLVEGKEIRLEKDIQDIDKYGRLLRYVYVGDTFINDTMVREGFASAVSYPPNSRYQSIFVTSERQARQEVRGLWGTCVLSPTPRDVLGNESDHLPGCDIKGNINADGVRVYHTPTCSTYSKTAISLSRGERWFCTEVEAIQSGWRKAMNCP